MTVARFSSFAFLAGFSLSMPSAALSDACSSIGSAAVHGRVKSKRQKNLFYKGLGARVGDPEWKTGSNSSKND
jgi:hypothetical protein